MISILRLNRVVFSLLLLLSSVCTMAMADSIQYEYSVSSRSIMRVGPNQTLDMLVQQMYPQYQQLWPQLKQQIKDRNPYAFNRYTGKLMAGQRLQLVTIKKIHRTTVTDLVQVGQVDSIRGYAVVSDKNGMERRLKHTFPVYEGDRLTTAKGAALVVKMLDGAEMRIKQDSSIRVSQYTIKSGFDKGNVSIIDLIKGGLRKITGSIAANPLSVYRFNTGVMTLGVRGTDYVVKLCSQKNCENSAGRNDPDVQLHVVVLDGLITLEDEKGERGELILGQYAVATADTKTIIDDSKPVTGLLNQEEQKLFDQTQAQESEEKNSIWPWLIGGILLGIGI